MYIHALLVILGLVAALLPGIALADVFLRHEPAPLRIGVGITLSLVVLGYVILGLNSVASVSRLLVLGAVIVLNVLALVWLGTQHWKSIRTIRPPFPALVSGIAVLMFVAFLPTTFARNQESYTEFYLQAGLTDAALWRNPEGQTTQAQVVVTSHEDQSDTYRINVSRAGVLKETIDLGKVTPGDTVLRQIALQEPGMYQLDLVRGAQETPYRTLAVQVGMDK